MDKLEKLYNLYLREGIISNATSFEKWKAADSIKQEKLFELGKSNGLFKTSTVDKFKAAWAEAAIPEVKKKGMALPSEDGSLDSSETDVISKEDLLQQTVTPSDRMQPKPTQTQVDYELGFNVAPDERIFEEQVVSEAPTQRDEFAGTIISQQPPKAFSEPVVQDGVSVSEQVKYDPFIESVNKVVNKELVSNDLLSVLSLPFSPLLSMFTRPDATEENVIPQMRYYFGEYGFEFEPADVFGDGMTVKAKNGKQTYVNLDQAFGGEKTAEDLKKFLIENREVKEYAASDRKIYDEQQIKDAVGVLNEQAKEWNNATVELGKLKALNEQMSQELLGISQYDIDTNPEIKQKVDMYNRNIAAEKELLDVVMKKGEEFEGKGILLDRLAGEYYAMKGEQGGMIKGITAGILGRGPANIASGGVDYGVDIYTYLSKNASLTEDKYKEELIRIAKEDGYLPEDEDFSGLSKQQLIERLGGDTNDATSFLKSLALAGKQMLGFDPIGREKEEEALGVPTNFDKVNAKVLDYARKGIKYYNDYGVEGLDYDKAVEGRTVNPFSEIAAKVDTEMGLIDASRQSGEILSENLGATKEWSDLTKEGFWGGALLGLAESIPAMVGGMDKVGSAQRIAQMFLMTSSHVENEMSKNPEFDNISESEKLPVKIAIGTVGAVLENYGFRNILKNNSFVANLALRALKKVPKGSSVKTLSDVISQDIESSIARGGLTLFAAGASEFETGAAQELSSIIIKDIYNETKGKEMFQTPESLRELAGQVLYAGAQEAIGGKIMGAPGAIISAVGGRSVQSLSDMDWRNFEMINEDPTMKEIYVSKLKAEIANPKSDKTLAEAKAELESVNRIQGLLNSNKQYIGNLSPEQKKRAVQLLLQKQELENKLKNADSQLSSSDRNLLERVNDELGDLSKASTRIEESMEAEEKTIQEYKGNLMDWIKSIGKSKDIGDVMEGGVEIDMDGTKVIMTESDGGVVLESIETQKGKKGQGKAEAAIKKITEKADNDGVNITLKVVPKDSTVDAKRLQSLYERNGFEMQEDGVTMVRTPKVQELTQEQRDIEAFFAEDTDEDIERASDNLSINRTNQEQGSKSPNRASAISAAKFAAKAISKVAPKVRIVLHEAQSEYSKYVKGEGSSSGEYNPETNVIHINLSNVRRSTVAHEVFHAILVEKVKGDDALAKKISDDMVRVVQRRLPKNHKLRIAVEAHAAKYQGDQANLQTEEQIAELIGLLSSVEGGYTKLDSDMKSVIKKFFLNLAKKLNIPLPKNWGSDQDVVDLINTLARKTRTGEAITEKDVKLLDVKEGTEVDSKAKSRKQIASKASSVEMFKNPDILQPKRMANGRTKVIDLGRAFDKRARDNGYYIPIPKNGVYTDSQLNKIADAMTDDAELQLKQDDSGIGWYDLKTKSAMELMSRIHPELSNSNSKAHLEFTLMVALISQNNSVGINFRQANDAYTYYKNNNKLPDREYAGKSGNIIKQNIALAFEAIKSKGWENHKKTLQETKTVKEWEAEGYKINGENKTTEITGAMAMLGSKIGSFWGNLNGDFSTLTADLWFSRMFNRYTGNVVSKKGSEKSKQATLNELKKYKGKTLLYGYKKSDILKGTEVFDKWLNTIVKEYANGGYKDKQRLNIVSNTHFKNTKGELQDIPRGGNERNAMRDVVKRVQDKLIERGYPKLDIADIQAILWYNEKDLYRLYKAVNKSSEKTDYETAAQEVLREQGINAEVALPFKRSKSSTDGGRKQTDTAQSKSVSSEEIKTTPATRKQIIGENAELSENVRNNYVVANQMEAAKKSAKDIRTATGWERGADGKWRYEIDDVKIKDSFNVYDLKIVQRYRKAKLSDIIDNKKLFESYSTPLSKEEKVDRVTYYKNFKPLADVNVYFSLVDRRGPFGEYDPRFNDIIINIQPGNATLEEISSTLLHEIQHYIQEREGFETGGNINENGYKSYERLAGEVEARNVETRMNMTPEQRRQTLLQATEDVAREDQIFFESTPATRQQKGETMYRSDLTKAGPIQEVTPSGMKAFNEGVESVQQAAKEYRDKFAKEQREKNRTYQPGRVNPPMPKLYDRVSKMMADAYAVIKNEPTKEDVKKAYDALVFETKKQYEFIVGKGLKVIKHEGVGEPYANSKEMLKDIRDNNTLKFLPNEVAFGQGDVDVSDNVGLQSSGLKLDDGYELTNSEVFRIVHDYFGHGILGNQFGPIGEENATLQHLDLYSDDAAPAVIFQTRGQNSWVNFSGANKKSNDLRRQAKELRKQGKIKEAKELVEKANKLFKFAEPKIAIFPNKFNFKRYETARRISEQETIDSRPNRRANVLSGLLEKYSKRSSGTRGVNKRNLRGVKRLGVFDVNVIAEYTLDKKISEGIKKAFPNFKEVQKIYEVTDGNVYRKMMVESLKDNRFAASVTVHSAEDFNGMRMFVTEDGSTGITITKEGFLGGAFSNPNANRPNNLAQLMVIGIKEGATTAEAFDTVLPDYYSRFGFKAVSRTSFNEEFKPMVKNGNAIKDWDFETYKNFNNGKPDVVFFIYDGGNRNTIEERLGLFDLYGNYEKANTKSFDKNGYDKAEEVMKQQAVKRLEFEGVDAVKDTESKPAIRQSKSTQEYISEARKENFKDSVIRDFLIRVKGKSAKEVDELMSLSVSLLDKMPKSFGNVKGGAKVGLKLYEKVERFRIQEQKRNNKRKNKLTEQEIIDKTIEFLEKQPEYINEGDTYTVGSEKKGTQKTLFRAGISSQQAKMLSDIQKSIGIRPTQNMGVKIAKARLALRERRKGAIDLQKVKTEVRNFIRKTLPSELYEKKEVLDLINKVNEANEGNIENIISEIEAFVVETNNKSLQKKIDGVLNGKYQTVEGGRRKPKKITDEIRKRIEFIKSNLVSPESTPEEIGEANTKLLERFNEIQEQNFITPEQLEEQADIQVAMQYNNAMLMENSNSSKVTELDGIYSTLEDLINHGRSLLQEELRKSHEAYNKTFELGYEAITGEKVDMNDPDSKRQLNNQKKKRFSDEKRKKNTQGVIRRFVSNIGTILKAPFGSAEALNGLMSRLDKLPGEMFGGRLNEMFTERVDESSRRFKMRMMQIESVIANYLAETYGKKWKQISRQNRMQVDHNIELHDGIMLQPLSQDEIAYLYNMYKDPANRASFANPDMWGSEVIEKDDSNDLIKKAKELRKQGKIKEAKELVEKAKAEKKRKQEVNEANAARIMKELEAKLDPKVKEFADWQVDVLYPALYEEYNKTYKKLYRTDLPWNKFYAGTIYRDGFSEADTEVMNLLGRGNTYKTAVGANSTKVRQGSNLPIKPMNMTDVLNTYINDMEYFAAYGETIRDMDKFFSNKYVKSAIIDIHGQEVYMFVDDMIKKIASRGMQNSGFRAKTINALNDVFILSRLALSPVIAIKQLTSTFTYANDIGYANWIKYAAINKTQQLKVWKEISENSVYIQDRYKNSITKAIETYSDTKMKAFLPETSYQQGWNWFVDFAMYTTKLGDKGAIYLGGSPNYSYYKDQALKQGKTEKEAIDIAIRKFERDTKRTQQSSDIQDKDYLQTGDPITKALNMFLTTPKQYLRNEIIAVRNLYRAISGKAYKGTVGQNVRTFVTYHFFMPLLFQYVSMGLPGILRGFRDDDDKDLLRAAIIGNLNGLFILGEVVNTIGDLFTGKPWVGTQTKSLGILQIVNSLARKFNKAANYKDPDKKAKAFLDAYLELSTLTGIPAPTVKKFFENYSKLNTADDPGEIILRLLNYSEYQISGPPTNKSKVKSVSEMNEEYQKEKEKKEKDDQKDRIGFYD